MQGKFSSFYFMNCICVATDLICEVKTFNKKANISVGFQIL